MEVKIRGKTALLAALIIVFVIILVLYIIIKARNSENSNTAVMKNAENYITSSYAAEDYTFEPGVNVETLGSGVYQVDGAMFDKEDVEHSFSERVIETSGDFTVEELMIDNEAVLPQ